MSGHVVKLLKLYVCMIYFPVISIKLPVLSGSGSLTSLFSLLTTFLHFCKNWSLNVLFISRLFLSDCFSLVELKCNYKVFYGLHYLSADITTDDNILI